MPYNNAEMGENPYAKTTQHGSITAFERMLLNGVRFWGASTIPDARTQP
jgi:hypothetical protein